MMHEFRVAEPLKPPRRSGVNDMRVYIPFSFILYCMSRGFCRLIYIMTFLVCLFVCFLQLDGCVQCRVYRKGEGISERSRYESRLDESSSSPKIPRLELNPNPNEANNP